MSGRQNPKFAYYRTSATPFRRLHCLAITQYRLNVNIQSLRIHSYTRAAYIITIWGNSRGLASWPPTTITKIVFFDSGNSSAEYLRHTTYNNNNNDMRRMISGRPLAAFATSAVRIRQVRARFFRHSAGEITTKIVLFFPYDGRRVLYSAFVVVSCFRYTYRPHFSEQITREIYPPDVFFRK